MKLHHNPRLDLAGKLLLADAVLMIIGLLFLVNGCSAQSATAADGLDLHALIGVVRQSTNGEDLERRLNSPGSINNLDLNGVGKADFIDVTEFGSGIFRGYSLAVHMDEHNTQEIATIDISYAGEENITIQVHGNEQIYGANAFVISQINRAHLNTIPFLVWAFAPRPLYVRPIVIGYRPAWYVPVAVIPVTQYRTVTKTITRTVVVERPTTPIVQAPSSAINPNAGKAATTVKATLAAPTTTQQQFQSRPENKAVSRGGFGTNKKVEAEKGAGAATKGTVDTSKTQKQFEQRDTNKAIQSGGFGNKVATPPQSSSSSSSSSQPQRKK